MKAESLILAADIGGTNVRFACLEHDANGEAWNVHDFIKLRGADYPCFHDALETYLQTIQVKPKRAAFCAAGPVKNHKVNLTNTDWHISARDVERMHGINFCGLYNDFAGMTRSIPELEANDFSVIRKGQSKAELPILVAGPGTGFGVGFLIPVKHGWHVIATEGGHMTYSPQTPLEMQLLKVLSNQHDFVSLELVSSGKGLPDVHRAICAIHNQSYAPIAPEIIRKLAHKNDPVCRDVCLIRAAATMGAIGDLALSGGAQGGIVLAGGVSERMIDFYTQPAAMDRFLNRGARSNYVKDIPVKLLKNPLAPLIGSAAILIDTKKGS